MLLRYRTCFVIVLLYAFSLSFFLLVKRVNHFDRKKNFFVRHTFMQLEIWNIVKFAKLEYFPMKDTLILSMLWNNAAPR